MNRRSVFGSLFGLICGTGIKPTPMAFATPLKAATLSMTVPDAIIKSAVASALAKVRVTLPDGSFQIIVPSDLTDEDENATIFAAGTG